MYASVADYLFIFCGNYSWLCTLFYNTVGNQFKQLITRKNFWNFECWIGVSWRTKVLRTLARYLYFLCLLLSVWETFLCKHQTLHQSFQQFYSCQVASLWLASYIKHHTFSFSSLDNFSGPIELDQQVSLEYLEDQGMALASFVGYV